MRCVAHRNLIFNIETDFQQKMQLAAQDEYCFTYAVLNTKTCNILAILLILVMGRLYK